MEDTEIKKILNDFTAYLHPDIFKMEYRERIKPGKNFNKKYTEKYKEVIMSIEWFLKKVCRYEIYFLEFYPNSTNIKKSEALEHHFHAYLEDIETLKNKILRYIGELKNDIQKIAVNKKEISTALKWLNNHVHKVFEKTSKIRIKHRHSNSRFVDYELNKVGMADIMLSEDFPLKDQLTEYTINSFRKQKEESFEKTKSFWVQTAKTNISQLEGVTNEVFEKTKSFLYQYLDITPVDFIKENHDRNQAK